MRIACLTAAECAPSSTLYHDPAADALRNRRFSHSLPIALRMSTKARSGASASPPSSHFSPAATLVVGALLGACFAWWAAQHLHPGLVQDGPAIVDLFTSRHLESPRWYHPLYFPLAYGLSSFAHTGSNGLWALHALGLVAGALGVALLVLLARLCDPRLKANSVLVVLAAVASPALWLHAEIIEVHMLQFLGANLAVLCAFSSRPWSRVRRLFLFALATFLMAGLHRANLLFVPVLALVAAFDARSAWLRGAIVASIGGSLGIAAFWVIAKQQEASNIGVLEMSIWLVDAFGEGLHWRFLRNDVVLAVPLVVFAVLSGCMGLAWRSRLERDALVGAIALSVPLSFFLWFGEGTRGGYLLSCLPGAVVLTIAVWRACPFALADWCARAGLLALSLLGFKLVGDEHRSSLRTMLGQARARNVAAAEQLVETLGSGIQLLTMDLTRQRINGLVAGCYELNLSRMMVQNFKNAKDLDHNAALMAQGLREHRSIYGRVVIDMRWETELAHLDARIGDFMRPLIRELGKDRELARMTLNGRDYLY